MRVDIAIMTIREDEFKAVRSLFQTERRRISNGRTYLIGEVRTKKQKYTIAIARCIEPGNDASQRLAHDIIQDLDPRLILVVGIAGGVPHDEFTLGDVVVSTRIVNPNVDAWYPDGTTDYSTNGSPPHSLIEDIVSLLPGEPQLAGWTNTIQLERPPLDKERANIIGDDEWREKIRKSLNLHFGEEHNQDRSPTFTIGHILSSNHLMKDPARLRKILKTNRSILAAEMEVAGVKEAAQGIDHQYPVMAIRGISDIVGLQRDSRWTKYACQTAAAFTYAFIMTDPLEPLPDQMPIALSEISAAQLLSSESTLDSSQPSVWNPLQSLTSIWNVPFRRNLLFMDRRNIIRHIHDMLVKDKSALEAPPVVLTGLGGVGKTQIVIEYAHQYRNHYNIILWIRADSNEILVSDFVNIATLLKLPEKNEHDQNIILSAVKQWLQAHTSWLIILDNVEDLTTAMTYIPTNAQGHILMTARSQAKGPDIQSIPIVEMDKDEGTLFLLRRGQIIAEDDSLDNSPIAARSQASEIVEIMGGLPLALDQAGAYIEETGCSLSEYLDLYRKQRAKLLNRRGNFSLDHSVATTWSLSFEKIKRKNSFAAQLLNLCAFIYADDIPLELFVNGSFNVVSSHQTIPADPFQLNNAIEELRRFSLIKRESESRILSMHRLVQTVLQDSMNKNTQRKLAERVVMGFSLTFPPFSHERLPVCKRYLPHALMCKECIEHWNMRFPNAALLLLNLGIFLHSQSSQFKEAEKLHTRALDIFEEVLGSEAPLTGAARNNLANLFFEQDELEKAEQLFKRALDISLEKLGPEHTSSLTIFLNLAQVYIAQGEHEKGKKLLYHVLSIEEEAAEPNGLRLTIALNNLAMLYRQNQEFEEAEHWHERALGIQERVLLPDDPSVAITLFQIAQLNYLQRKYEKAEQLYKRSLHIYEKVLGPNHPQTIESWEDYYSL